ncbi:hypothetical protein M404DRAFT_1001743 [Pisolithus tinctorius Marx 270]|uniref:Uncharacterized protein n=1 Tax=Pisolithus tinctorius Marx 270 TaxID=870435 RepID=A0A0C3NQI0_PISTI|nr:hypothetical protein M404DRAFT_1001743 [Pisolithus tinctorius Marx 270]
MYYSVLTGRGLTHHRSAHARSSAVLPAHRSIAPSRVSMHIADQSWTTMPEQVLRG